MDSKEILAGTIGLATALVALITKALSDRRKAKARLSSGEDSDDIPDPNWPRLLRQMSEALEQTRAVNETQGVRIDELELALGEMSRIHEATERRLLVALHRAEDLTHQLADSRAARAMLEARVAELENTDDVAAAGATTDKLAAVRKP